MKRILRSFLAKWWSPPITHLALYALFMMALPILTLDLLNSRTLVLAEIILGGLLAPIALALLHRASWKAAAAVELVVALVIFFTWPTEQFGNWKMQIAGRLLGWSLMGFIGCALAQSVFLFRAGMKK